MVILLVGYATTNTTRPPTRKKRNRSLERDLRPRSLQVSRSPSRSLSLFTVKVNTDVLIHGQGHFRCPDSRSMLLQMSLFTVKAITNVLIHGQGHCRCPYSRSMSLQVCGPLDSVRLYGSHRCSSYFLFAKSYAM